MNIMKSKYKFITFLLTLMLFAIVAPLTSFGEKESGTRQIKIFFSDDKKEDIKNLSFDYWKLNEDIQSDLTDEDKILAFTKKYENMTCADVKKTLGESKKTQAFDGKSSEVVIDNMPYGLYLFKQSDDFKSDKIYTPTFVILVSDKISLNGQEITPKTIIPAIKLIKVDSEDKKPLAGAIFKLYRKDKDKDSPIKVKELEKGKKGAYKADDNGDIEKMEVDSTGLLKVEGLENGKTYYFMEEKAPDGYIKSKEKSKDLSVGDEIEFLNTKNKEQGYFNFVKIDDTKEQNHLKGAEFLLSRKLEDGSYVEVKKPDGSSYKVTSDDKGEFKVGPLAFGDYKLTETKSPANYYLKVSDVEFTINKDSKKKGLFITNKKTPPGRITKIPPSETVKSMVKTGDIRIFAFLLSGLLMVIFGVKLTKTDNNELKVAWP